MSEKILTSTDAREWAEEFIKTVEKNDIKIDIDFMTTWFANALMTQYDHDAKELKQYLDQITLFKEVNKDKADVIESLKQIIELKNKEISTLRDFNMISNSPPVVTVSSQIIDEILTEFEKPQEDTQIPESIFVSKFLKVN